MKFASQKLHGCQNDYIFFNMVNESESPIDRFDLSKMSQDLSDRTKSAGSDGLIFLLPPDDASKNIAKMKMYNSDGSEGMMCGNGIRCAAKLLHEALGARESFRIETNSGVRECFVVHIDSPERFQVRVNMGRPSFMPNKIPVLFDDVMVLNEEFEAGGKDFVVSCVSMGNPHCVVEVDDLESFEVEKYGPLIEKHEAFPERTNVEFIKIIGNQIHQRTWERGSGETKACGTGACAAAVTQIMLKKLKSPVEVVLKGGKLLVEWDGLREVWMQGEAVSLEKADIDFSAYKLN